MASSVESSLPTSPRSEWHRGRLAAGIALSLAMAAASGAIWLLAVERASPWDAAFVDLGSTGEICRTAGDATADTTARMAESHGQLDNFIRQRFDQLLSEARLSQERTEREATARAAAQRPDPATAEAARLETRLWELNGERSRLLERLTPHHPSVIDIDRQIADLDRQRAALAPAIGDRGPVARESEIAPAARWKELLEHSVVEYDQHAAACRRAERQFDEAQAGYAAALDNHLATIGRWSDAATNWATRLAMPAILGSCLWAMAAAALAVLGWMVARNMPVSFRRGADRLITSAAEIERWFSLPVVKISAVGDETGTPADAARRPSRWLVLPAQFAVAVAVFCLVAITIQNPTWFGSLWAR